MMVYKIAVKLTGWIYSDIENVWDHFEKELPHRISQYVPKQKKIDAFKKYMEMPTQPVTT